MSLPSAAGITGLLAAKDPVPQLLRDLIHERIGVHFEPDRFNMMLEKLAPRIAALGCHSYLDYFHVLKYDERGEDEWRRVMDAFSVQETYFWRELDQVNTLVHYVVPEWFKTHTGPLRIWSAACATGEEPYSIALALCEAGWGSHPIEIIASDASETALVKARAAKYRERSFRALPAALKAKYFERSGEEFLLKPEIASRVSFHWTNLMKPEDLPQVAAVQAIFCRNVFIYFSPLSIKRVVASFAERLPLRGYLFVGASESLLKLTERFDLEEVRGAFVYVRNAVP